MVNLSTIVTANTGPPVTGQITDFPPAAPMAD